jgi:hypothetical protein
MIMYNVSLPPELVSWIGNDKIVFSIKARRRKPLFYIRVLVFFGIFWIVVILFPSIKILGPLLLGEEVIFDLNDGPAIGSLENFEPILKPVLIMLFWHLPGVGILLLGIYYLHHEGGYFVGTNNRLIHYFKGEIHSYIWKNFSGEIHISSNNSDISFQLKTGHIITEDSRQEFVRDIVYISGIPDALEIEKICRQRIEEHDPATPAQNEL